MRYEAAIQTINFKSWKADAGIGRYAPLTRGDCVTIQKLLRRRLSGGGGGGGGMMLRVGDDRHLKLAMRNFKIMVAIKISQEDYEKCRKILRVTDLVKRNCLHHFVLVVQLDDGRRRYH